MPTSERLRSLDGLRGVAAAVFVMHHSRLTFPSLADAYCATADGNPVASNGSV